MRSFIIARKVCFKSATLVWFATRSQCGECLRLLLRVLLMLLLHICFSFSLAPRSFSTSSVSSDSLQFPLLLGAPFSTPRRDFVCFQFVLWSETTSVITLQCYSHSLSIDHIAFATLLLQKIFDCRGNEMERGGRVGVVLLIFVCVFTYRLCLVLPQGAACLGGGREFVR